jgi:hypothetical protein
MLSWAWKYRATDSGLEEAQFEWWTRWSFEYKTRERTHAPTIEEIARTLVIATRFRHLADGEHETYPGTLGALWGVALTAQRTGAFLQLRLDRLFDATKVLRRLRGWKIANWTPNEMKGGRDGGRPHSLPILRKRSRFCITFMQRREAVRNGCFPAATPKNTLHRRPSTC